MRLSIDGGVFYYVNKWCWESPLGNLRVGLFAKGTNLHQRVGTFSYRARRLFNQSCACHEASIKTPKDGLLQCFQVQKPEHIHVPRPKLYRHKSSSLRLLYLAVDLYPFIVFETNQQSSKQSDVLSKSNNLDLQLASEVVGRDAVLWYWVLNLWKPMPTPGRKCQNWVKFVAHQVSVNGELN